MGTVIRLDASSAQFRDAAFRVSYKLLKKATEEEPYEFSDIKRALAFITDYVGGKALDKARLATWMEDSGADVTRLERRKESLAKKGFDLLPDEQITLRGMKAALDLFGAIERAEKEMPLSARTCKMILAQAEVQPA